MRSTLDLTKSLTITIFFSVVMSSLDADDLELEEYFDVLFNSTEAVLLLVSSVESDSDAQQAVVDVIANNTQVSVVEPKA